MIEIKHRNGSVLYTAKDTTDIRHALQEARNAGAYLARADLAGANLARADLAGANLADADLAGAYLAGANLAGAYLADANLAGADLARADLTRADLARADLTRANLARANLADANLTRADLAGADLTRANLARANLAGANLADANLARADLADANLTRANLAGADLADANLAGADLADANLTRADLAGAKGINAWRVDPIRFLLDQPGPIRAYKLVDNTYGSPITKKPRLEYKVGTRLEVNDANTDERYQCGAGINVATWTWVAANYLSGYRVMAVEFQATDIAAIPVGTDGKFRLHRCVVVDEVTDLAARGITT